MINILFFICLLIAVPAKSETYEKVDDFTIKITSQTIVNVDINRIKVLIEQEQLAIEESNRRIAELQKQLDNAASIGVRPRR